MSSNTNNSSDSPAPPSNQHPLWLRPSDVQHHFGIKRGLVYQLIEAGKIRSVSLKQPGAVRGARLVSYESLKSYIESLDTE